MQVICLFLFFSYFRIFFSLLNFIDEQTNTDDGISSDLVQGFVHSVNVDINELTNQNKCIDLQHTFRPIFVQFFKTNLYHRYKAVTFRRVLAEKGFDLKSLEDIWNEKKKVRRIHSIFFLSSSVYFPWLLLESHKLCNFNKKIYTPHFTISFQ